MNSPLLSQLTYFILGDSGGNIVPTDIGEEENTNFTAEYFSKRREAVQVIHAFFLTHLS